MDFLTFSLFFAWGLLGFFGGILTAAKIKPKDPRVTAMGKRLMETEIELADLRDLYERLMTSHKRLRSAAGMAKLRGMKEEKADESVSDSLSEAEILRRMRLRGVPKP